MAGEADTGERATPVVGAEVADGSPLADPPRPPEPEPADAGTATILDLPPEALAALVAAKEERRARLAKVGSEPPSEAATTRPAADKPSPFAGLLAEADAAEKTPARKALEKASPGDTLPAAKSGRRKNQETLSVGGRGRTEPDGQRPDRSLGAYRILGELGTGGMAVVYKAVQGSVDRLVAIKELRPEYLHDRQVTARFEREATSLATMQHGNIVHIYDFVRDFESAYIVMEYVDGIDLFDVLAKVGRLSPDVAAVIGLQIALGLEYAHYRGIVHRDVKPSNILISKIGEIKLMDFGIARDPGRANITQIGMALGTPAYMAPEQIRGDQIDSRADLFSFGICLYEMLSGEKPWADDGGQSVARRILFEEPTPIRRRVPDVPAPLEAIIERCIAKDPARRYATTHELRRALEGYVAREVDIDLRQRLVVFLRNRGLITDGDASAVVESALLADPVLRRRDHGVPLPAADAILKRVFVACAVALLGIFAAAVVGAVVDVGIPLPSKPPTLVVAE